jgi:hypothetical protein
VSQAQKKRPILAFFYSQARRGILHERSQAQEQKATKQSQAASREPGSSYAGNQTHPYRSHSIYWMFVRWQPICFAKVWFFFIFEGNALKVWWNWKAAALAQNFRNILSQKEKKTLRKIGLAKRSASWASPNAKRTDEFFYFIFIFFYFFKNIWLISNFAKVYYCRHITWHLGPNAVLYSGWRHYSVPTAVWYGVCRCGYCSACKRRVVRR